MFLNGIILYRMKNLLIYINPRKAFDNETSTLVKIQIDNSLFFWKPEDILLVTNFPYQYRSVKAMVVNDNLFCPIHDKASKINTIIHLIENGYNEYTWMHDFDAFQLHPISLKIDKDVGFTDYGWSRKWNTGSIFFKPSSLDIFKWLRDGVYKNKTDEERALVILTDSNFNNINSRCQRLNITYNFGMRKIDYNFQIAEKPLKVVHFHPNYKDRRIPASNLDCFMYGKNPLNQPLITDRLIQTFQHYGIK